MIKEKLDELLKNDKTIKIIFFIGAGLILLIALSSFIEPEKDTAVFSSGDYTTQLERRLENIISEIDGVGKIKVMITLENIDEKSNSNTLSPVVRGVAVVCEGGNNIILKQKIVETVSKVLGISTTRVSVTY